MFDVVLSGDDQGPLYMQLYRHIRDLIQRGDIKDGTKYVISKLSLYGSFIHLYGDRKGEYALRDQLAHYLKHSRGVSCSPEQIVVGSGISL